MDSVSVTDLYQASFLLLNGCTLTSVECIPMTGSIACRMTFAGSGVASLVDAWFDKSASANLWAFRAAYNQVNSYVHQAKKGYDRSRRSGEGGGL
jgi:hypothetical protein